MKSTPTLPPKDSAGIDFNPSLHQVHGDGSPRLTKDGRYFLKGFRRMMSAALKAPAAITAPRPITPAPITPRAHPAPLVSRAPAAQVAPITRTPPPVTPAKATAPESPATESKGAGLLEWMCWGALAGVSLVLIGQIPKTPR